MTYLTGVSPNNGRASQSPGINTSDPRWKKGAKVRLEYTDGSALEGFVEKTGSPFVGYRYNTHGSSSCLVSSDYAFRIILLEADPDPLAERREYLENALSHLHGVLSAPEWHDLVETIVPLMKETS